MKIRIIQSVVLGALPLLLIARHPAEAVPDAVSAASIIVSSSNVTATGATINYYQDKFDYGTRTLCYDPTPVNPTHNCTTKNASGNQGSFTVTGLKAATQYNYSIKAMDPVTGGRPYTSTGTFKTPAFEELVPSSLGPPAPDTGAWRHGRKVDALGRSLHDARASGEGVVSWSMWRNGGRRAR